MEQYILAIDQGTSGTKSIIFNAQGKPIAKGTAPLQSYFPQVGFVEQNPGEIYTSALDSVKACVQSFRETTAGNLDEIAACGISNQRETFVLWDESGTPLTQAVVWQCKRSVDICDRLKETGMEPEITAKTGLIIDPYFSGTKMMWLYEHDARVQHAVDAGNAYFGTVDAWLLFQLTNGQRYYTDYTNACRTLLFNIHELQWDRDLLKAFNLQNLNLPEAKPSAFHYGETDFEGLLPTPLPITGMLGDSHAAAFGEGCFSSGTAKTTLGTGSSILMNTGSQPVSSKAGMMTTICWSTPDRVDYALEGIIVTCGATIVWLRDQLGLFAESRETEAMALAVDSNNGVHLIPAFSGLGAPHWKMNAKAAILGLTFGCNKNHLVRAALETIPFQIKDIITAMETDSGIPLQELKADGGITVNQFVMQCLADVLNTLVTNIGFEDVSALGAAYMAGLEKGVFQSLEHLQKLNASHTTFTPGPNRETVYTTYQAWEKALQGLL